MLHLDTMIEERNPGTKGASSTRARAPRCTAPTLAPSTPAEMLEEHGIDLIDMAFRLSDTLPCIISTDFNPNASAHSIRASMLELKEAMAKAEPLPQTMTREEWLTRRAAAPGPARIRKEHGKITNAVLAPVPETGTMDHRNTHLNKLLSLVFIHPPPRVHRTSPGAARRLPHAPGAPGERQGLRALG